MSALQLLFLGPSQFRKDGRTLELTAAKAIALLAYLAATARPQPRDRLAGLLWPDSLPEAARKNLRNTLWTVRKELDEDLLHADAGQVALDPAIWVDVRVFEGQLGAGVRGGTQVGAEFQAAVGLYRGPFLEGLTLSDAPDFDLWIATQREHLGQVYLRGLEALVAVHRSAADWPQVIDLARRALAYDNLQESMVRALMEAHAHLGERPEALRQYDALVTTLARELGVEPLAETQALRQAIVQGEFRLSSSGVPTAPVQAGRSPVSPSPSPAPFVGRQAELDALAASLGQVATGQAQVILLAGELGIGKTRLWQEWSASLPSETLVLESRGLEATHTLPFAPLTGLLRRRSCFERLFRPPSPLSPIWLAELARLLPELREHFPHISAPVSLPPAEERHRLFEALSQVMVALDTWPLVFWMDDLHRVDSSTLDWLSYFVDRMRDRSLLLAGAYRPDDASGQLIQLVARWSRDRLAQRLPLSRLTPAETAELLSRLGAAGAAQLHARSAGNPYFLIELSRSAAGDVPAPLAELLRSRLDRLPDPAHQVLQAAAVLDVDFDFNLLRRTSGRGEEETLSALDTLLKAGVLVERQGRYEFSHPLLASVVQAGLSVARRSFLHRRAAEALVAGHGGRLDPAAGQIAGHYAQAGRTEQAARYADLAAQRALALSAPAEAVTLLRQALTLQPTPSRRFSLGQALSVQGEPGEARLVLSQALDDFQVQGDEAGATRACLALAESYLPSGRGDLAIRWAEEGLSRLSPASDGELQARTYLLLGAGGLHSDRPLAEVESFLLRAARLAAASDLPELSIQSLFEQGNLWAQRGDLPQALQSFAESIALARTHGRRLQEVLGHNNLAYHALLAGNLDTAQDHIRQGLDLAGEHSFFLPRQYLYSTQGQIALAQGQVGEAESWFRQALTEAERYDNRVQVANLQANLGQAARARGDLDEALALLMAARAALAEYTETHLQLQIALWLADLHIARGERPATEQILEQVEDRLLGGERRGLQAQAARIRAAVAGLAPHA